MTVLVNKFEGGTSGTSITTGNSGGASGNAWDSVTIGSGATLQYSNAHAAHGSLSCLCQTVAGNSTFLTWSTSMGSQSQIWFRVYLYFAANPSAVTRFFTAGGRFTVNTSGNILVQNTSAGTITTSTNTIPLNQWFRVEGFVIGGTSTAQTEVKLYDSMDGTTPTETDTSSANLNLGSLSTYGFGPEAGTANQGPYYMDDVALSNVGYPLPVVNAITLPATVNTTAAVQDQVGKQLPAAVATTGAVTRQPGKSLPVSVATTGSVQRSLSRALSAAVATVPALANGVNKTFTASVAAAGSLIRRIGKFLAGLVGTTASVSTGETVGQRPQGVLTITPAGQQAAVLMVTPAGAQAATLTITPVGNDAAVLTVTSVATGRATQYPPAATSKVPPAGPQQISAGT